MSEISAEYFVTEPEKLTVRVPSVCKEERPVQTRLVSVRKRTSVELSQDSGREKAPRRRRQTRFPLLPARVDPMSELSTRTLPQESCQALANSERKNSPPLRNDFPRRTPRRTPHLPSKPERKLQTPSYYHNLMAFFNRKSIYSTTPTPVLSRIKKVPQKMRWLTPAEECELNRVTTTQIAGDSEIQGLVVQHCFK